MKVLLTGSSGFIGRHLLAALRDAGHQVVVVSRRAGADAARSTLALDFGAVPPAAEWAAALAGVDVVVNCVGLFREAGRQSFEALHVAAPKALFDACVAAGVKRVVQVSSLGVDAGENAYQRSKSAGDAYLLALPIDAVVVRPSLVFGVDGASAGLFLSLASLPLLPLPAGGRQLLQPLHIDDAVEALRSIVEGGGERGSIALVGAKALSLADYLQALRRALGLSKAPTFPVPAGLVGAGARLAGRFPGSLLDASSWQMLQQGSHADVAATHKLLGRMPRPPQEFVPPEAADAARMQARLRWLNPLLRFSLALVWIATGIVSLGVYPLAQSYELLARSGVTSALQPTMLVGASALDIVFGVLTLWPLRSAWRRRLWLAQIGLIAAYTAVVGAFLPEFWLHPFGPLTKNLPMLALLVLLLALEPPDPE